MVATFTSMEHESSSYTVRPLDASTWDAFAELVERNGGVFGGCWCMGHRHPSIALATAAGFVRYGTWHVIESAG